MPRRLRYPQHFMPGDQGILNYVFNQKAMLKGLRVERRKIMHWPGHGMQGLSANALAQGISQPLIIHWAGIKKFRQRDMMGSDVLAFFEKKYYEKIPGGQALRFFNGFKDALGQRLYFLMNKVLSRLIHGDHHS